VKYFTGESEFPEREKVIENQVLQPQHTQCAHVGERHRRAGRVALVWCHYDLD